MDGERVLVNMDQGRKRLDHLRRDARVSITVLKEHGVVHPRQHHRHGSSRCTTTRGSSTSTGSPGTNRGRQYSDRSRGRVSALIEVERWHGWGDVRER